MSEPRIASIKDYCSMPHERVIVTPIFMSIITIGVSLRTLSRCDLFITQWGMDCGDDGSCGYNTHLSFGLLFRENVVRVLHNGLPVRQHQCQKYTEVDEWILGDITWRMSRIFSFCSLVIASSSSMCLLTTFCVAYRKIFIRCFSFGYLLSAVFNFVFLAPMFSQICRSQEDQCDPTGFNCIRGCSLNSSAWLQIACSVTHVACWLLCNSIPQYIEEKKLRERKMKEVSSHQNIENSNKTDKCVLRTLSTNSTDSESTDEENFACEEDVPGSQSQTNVTINIDMLSDGTIKSEGYFYNNNASRQMKLNMVERSMHRRETFNTEEINEFENDSPHCKRIPQIVKRNENIGNDEVMQTIQISL